MGLFTDKPKQLLTFDSVSNQIFWKPGILKYLQNGLVMLSCLLTNLALATDSTQKIPSPWSYLLYVEAFYAYDHGQPDNGKRQDFYYNYNRHAQPAINLAVGKLAYQKDRFKANFAALAGTYSTDNYAAEPPLLSHLLELNVAFQLHKSKALWLEAGILPSHIGFESAFSFDNATLSRSILAENSPYFMSGTQLKYSKNNWLGAISLLNGWQRLRLLNNQRLPALGTQINRSWQNWTLNWSSFTGLSAPDSARLWRTFHNTYAIWKPNDRFAATIGFDIGWQKQGTGVANWYSPVVIGRLALSPQWFIAGRIESYRDPRGGHIPVAAAGGFKAWGFSGNIDWQKEHWLLRLETRYLQSPTSALNPDANNLRENISLLLSISGRLQGTLPFR